MKVLVTGATGFIGREIVSELLENDYSVIALSRSKNTPVNESNDLTFYRADITDYESLADLEELEGVKAIIHSAGLAHQFGDTSREEFEAVNRRGTENIAKLGVKLGIEHFILIGSTAVYGIVQSSDNVKNTLPIDENTPTNPQTLYAESKLESEQVCRQICEASEIPLTIFRLAPVIGEANVGNVARLISSIDRNRFLWVGSGSNLKSLIYKRDVARACLRLVEKKNGATEIFNLAAQPILMKDFVGEIAARLNKKILPVKIPASFLRLIFRLNENLLKVKKVAKLSDTVEKWLSDDVYAADKIWKTYQFKPLTTVGEAVTKQIDFYKNQSSG